MDHFRLAAPQYDNNFIIRLTHSVELRRFGRIFLDVALSCVSFLLAMILRDGWSVLADDRIVSDSLAFSAVCAGVFLMTGLWRRSWRYVSLPDCFVMIRDIMIAVGAFTVLNLLIFPVTGIPRSVPLIAGFVMVTALGACGAFIGASPKGHSG